MIKEAKRLTFSAPGKCCRGMVKQLEDYHITEKGVILDEEASYPTHTCHIFLYEGMKVEINDPVYSNENGYVYVTSLDGRDPEEVYNSLIETSRELEKSE